MRRLALLIPDGVGLRNFVLGPFLGDAARRAQVDVLHTIPAPLVGRFGGGFDGAVAWHALRADPGGVLQEFLRNALGYAHLFRFGTGLMRRRATMLRRTAPWRRRLFTRTAQAIGRVAASQRGIELLDGLHARVASRGSLVAHYRQFFGERRPSVLFCSHQRPPRIVAPVLAARSLGIPTATFIFSWDNLTTKGRIAAPFDHYLVWSALMRDELLRYYPEVRADRVHIVGTPQFDPYADPNLVWTRERYFQHIGADPARPLICFSGGDAGTSPGDPEFVRILLDLIRAGRILGRPQVLLRPTPVDGGGRYDTVRHQYPELLFQRPAWIHSGRGTWADVIPLAEDVAFLANLTYHADLNINWASTMTLDFAIRDKPVVNVGFDMAQERAYGLRAWELYSLLEHYRPVLELGAARVARSPEELVSHVNRYLTNPGLDREARRRLVELEVGSPFSGSSGRIVDVLEQIAR